MSWNTGSVKSEPTSFSTMPIDEYEKWLEERRAASRAWMRVYEFLTPAQQEAWRSLTSDERNATYRMSAEEFGVFMRKMGEPPKLIDTEAFCRLLFGAMHKSAVARMEGKEHGNARDVRPEAPASAETGRVAD